MVLHEIVTSTMLTQVYAWLKWIWQVDAYEAKKTELVAENADLRSMLRSMQVYIYIYICSSSKICNWIMCTHFSGIWHNNHLKIAEMVSYITNWFSVPWHSDISYKWSLYILPAVFNWDSIYMSLHMKAMRLPKKIKMSWFMIFWKYSYSVIYISFPCVVSS